MTPLLAEVADVAAGAAVAACAAALCIAGTGA